MDYSKYASRLYSLGVKANQQSSHKITALLVKKTANATPAKARSLVIKAKDADKIAQLCYETAPITISENEQRYIYDVLLYTLAQTGVISKAFATRLLPLWYYDEYYGFCELLAGKAKITKNRTAKWLEAMLPVLYDGPRTKFRFSAKRLQFILHARNIMGGPEKLPNSLLNPDIADEKLCIQINQAIDSLEK